MWWFNAGVAPIYRSYTLALAIGDTVMPLDADVRRWLPGDAVSKTRSPCLASSRRAATRYVWRCSIRRRDGPAIQLAIAGRQTDGWYQVGEIVVN